MGIVGFNAHGRYCLKLICTHRPVIESSDYGAVYVEKAQNAIAAQ